MLKILLVLSLVLLSLIGGVARAGDESKYGGPIAWTLGRPFCSSGAWNAPDTRATCALGGLVVSSLGGFLGTLVTTFAGPASGSLASSGATTTLVIIGQIQDTLDRFNKENPEAKDDAKAVLVNGETHSRWQEEASELRAHLSEIEGVAKERLTDEVLAQLIYVF